MVCGTEEGRRGKKKRGGEKGRERTPPKKGLVGNKQSDGLRVDDPGAALGGALYPGRLALLLDFGLEVLPVAAGAVAVLALQRVRVQPGPVLAADVAHEPKGGLLQSGGPAQGGAQAGVVEYVVGRVHVLLDQALLLPLEVAEEDGALFQRQAQDARQIANLLVLFQAHVGGRKTFEVDLVRIPVLLVVLCIVQELVVVVFIVIELRVFSRETQQEKKSQLGHEHRHKTKCALLQDASRAPRQQPLPPTTTAGAGSIPSSPKLSSS